MVLVLSPAEPTASTSEVTTTTGLKGANFDLDSLTDEYGDIKIQFCDAVMSSCILDQNKYKNCVSGTGACTWGDREIARPVVNGTCDLFRKFCGQKLDDTLNKLYEAGALASNPDVTTKIDEKIKALNRLKHEVRTVASNANAGGHKAIESKKPASAPSDVAKKQADNELEQEEATV